MLNCQLGFAHRLERRPIGFYISETSINKKLPDGNKYRISAKKYPHECGAPAMFAVAELFLIKSRPFT
jgi:hypothetical protein